MKRALKSLVGILAIFGFMGQAAAAIINDNYVGSNDHGYGDRIGSPRYEIQNMEVLFGGAYMTVRVNTNFDAASDPYGIDFGDLFISVNGWNPNGSAPYMMDNAAMGESWEFVFDTSEGMLYGGDFSIALSDDLISTGTFRNGQEVQRAAGGLAYKGSYVNLNNVGYGGYIEYEILLESLGVSYGTDLGLKWGMTCANDTIEGVVRVSEPSSLFILGLGLLGLGVIKRKRS